MNINITNYESLLSAAKQQVEPQRLLFVFLKASLPKNHGSDEASRFYSGEGGELEAIMCVDKTLNELGCFSDLVEESKKMNQDWHIILVAGLSGRNGVLPNPVETEQALKAMVQSVQTGGDLSRYIAFDRTGIPIHFR